MKPDLLSNQDLWKRVYKAILNLTGCPNMATREANRRLLKHN